MKKVTKQKKTCFLMSLSQLPAASKRRCLKRFRRFSQTVHKVSTITEIFYNRLYFTNSRRVDQMMHN